MENESLSAQLQLLVHALSNSVLLLYHNYTLSFKLAALLIIAYLSFRFGRLTITDTMETQVKKLCQTLHNRQFYTVLLPNKMKRMANFRKTILVITFLIAGTIVSLFYIKHELVIKRNTEQQMLGGLVFVALLAISLLIWLYEIFLSFKINRGGFNDRLINEKLSELLKKLGKKPQFLLKSFLCAQKYQNRRQTTANTCLKNECKLYRQLARQKYEDISRLVESVIGFDWCSVCRKRPQFDEFLNFQGKTFHRKNGGTEQQQVTLRNEFLLGELQRMVKWVSQISPCNCSRRYWSESTRSIFDFKERDKMVTEKLLKLEQGKRS